MTRILRFWFLRRVLVVLAAITAGLALASSAASAAPTPSPSPTPVTTVAPLPLRPEAFLIHASTASLPDGTVVATGPVRGSGTDPAWTPGTTRDTWLLSGPAGSVRVLHSRIGPLLVDPASCTASLDQTVRWALLGRSGADRFAFGFGTARVLIRELLFRTRSGLCLPRLRPVAEELLVVGTGRAVNLRGPFAVPSLSPALIPVS